MDSEQAVGALLPDYSSSSDNGSNDSFTALPEMNDGVPQLADDLDVGYAEIVEPPPVYMDASPPLPAIDYLYRRTATPSQLSDQFPPLDAGLEVEAEGEIVWPIESWTAISGEEQVTSAPILLANHSWYIYNFFRKISRK